jgi:prenyltransferase beta subunit
MITRERLLVFVVLLLCLGLIESAYSSSTESGTPKTQKSDDTAYIIYKIETKFRGGEDITADLKTLLSHRKSDGGWGEGKKYPSTNLHTIFALNVLKKVNADLKIISSTIDYLRKRQNSDGGWGRKRGDESRGNITALIILGLFPFEKTHNLQNALRKASDYISSLKQPDGSFGEKPLR